MSDQSTSSKVRHIPRRSGVGIRQVFVPKAEKPKRRHITERPVVCGAEHPERTGGTNLRGEVIDTVTCTRQLAIRKGRPVPHKGEHRARLLIGIVERWIEVSA